MEGIKLYGCALDAQGHEIRLANDLSNNLDAADAVCAQMTGMIDAYIAKACIEAPESAIKVVDWRPASEPATLDLKQAGIASVVFGTSCSLNFDWIDLPVFEDNGYPGMSAVPLRFRGSISSSYIGPTHGVSAHLSTLDETLNISWTRSSAGNGDASVPIPTLVFHG